MSLAADYPLLDVMWTMFLFFGWVLFLWLLVTVYMDLFRRHDIGGGRKVLWVIFTLLLPFVGTFVYLIAEGRAMRDRQVKEYERAQAGLDARIRAVATNGVSTSTDQIARAKQMLDSGAITQDEFNRLKQKALVS